MKFVSLGLFTLIIIMTSQLFANTIYGFVREDATGEPLAYVNVFFQKSGLGAATNEDGYS